MNIFEVKVGGESIWKVNAFVSGVAGITFYSEDDNFLKFKVVLGTWNFNAAIELISINGLLNNV